MTKTTRALVAGAFLLVASGLWVVPARADDLKPALGPAIKAIEPKVIAWRRDIHQNPELSNREFRTAQLVADHLEALGLDNIQTGVAHTGVVATLVGGKPGPTIALRADMDALPVTEMTGLPFASKAKAAYNGNEVGVMHACGHDTHVAILMGAAEVLANARKDLPGKIRFIFQPAEEGAPEGEEGGAKLMIEEGVLEGPDAPEAIFGLHVSSMPAATLNYRFEGVLAAADWLRIVVKGRQTHGSAPWRGVDPIIVSAQIMTALQTIPSRQLNITQAPAVVTIGSIHGGVRGNIIPDQVEMVGTIRTFDVAMRKDLLERIERTAVQIAESAGAVAEVTIDPYAPVTYNDPDLARRMLPTLEWAAGEGMVVESLRRMGAEDFSYYVERIPGFYFFLGVNKKGVSEAEAPANHSPHFYVNEETLIVGLRAMVGVAVDYLTGP